MKQRGRTCKNRLATILLCVVAMVLLAPAGYLLTASFQNGADGYKALIMGNHPFWQAAGNSLWVCIVGAAGQLTVSALSGLGLAANRFPGRKWLAFCCTVVLLVPAQALLLPQYLLFRQMRLLDTRWSLVLPIIFSPLGTLLLWYGFSRIPVELMESAQMEGAGSVWILFHVSLPLCRRELLALLLISFAESWNLLEQPMAYIRSPEKMLLPVYLSTGAVSHPQQLFPACVLALMPAFILLMLLICGSKQQNTGRSFNSKANSL